MRVGSEIHVDNRPSDASAKWMWDLLKHLAQQSILHELMARYWKFVETLPPTLAGLAVDRQLIMGHGPSTPLSTIDELRLVLSIPWLFRESFPTLGGAILLDIGEAWLFLLLALLLRDHMSDGQAPVEPNTVALQGYLATKARSCFRLLIGDDPIFWQYFAAYEKQVVDALLLEKERRTLLTVDYTLNTAWSLGRGKLALYKAVPCLMARLTEQMHLLPALETSLDAAAAGRQLLDDVCDWEEDLERGHLTYPLAQAFTILKEKAMPIKSATVAAILDTTTIRENSLRQALQWHQAAISAVDSIHCAGWREFVTFSMGDCTNQLRWTILVQIAQAIHHQTALTSSTPTFSSIA